MGGGEQRKQQRTVTVKEITARDDEGKERRKEITKTTHRERMRAARTSL